MKPKLIFLIAIAFIIGSCHLFKNSNYQDVSYLYKYTLKAKSTNYWVFNNSDSITTIYFTINSSNLLFTKIDNSDKYWYKFKIKIELFQMAQSNKLIDAFEKIYRDTIKEKFYKEIQSSFSFPLKKGDYLAKIYFIYNEYIDSIVSYVNINKKSVDNAQNFLILDKESRPINKLVFTCNSEINLLYRNTNIKHLYVSHFSDDFPLATPPFTTRKEKPIELNADTSYIVEFKNGYSSKITFKRKGIYFFRIDTILNEGLAFFNFGNDFPDIKTTEQMLLPLRYISSKNEFSEMQYSEDKKSTIDGFWLKIAGNEEKAKRLIKKYYNLVQEANIYFTSYQEGWKTDRGIIYIIYGPPNFVYRTSKSETWIYGAANNRSSTKFYFYKVENKFTDNDYGLNKSESYKDSWYFALSKWRKS